MLALTRKNGQRIKIGDNIIVGVAKSVRGKASLFIDAPPTIPIVREELLDSPLPAAFAELEQTVADRAKEEV